MKSFVILALLVAAAAAVPVSGGDRDAVVTKYNYNNIGDGSYDSSYETSNGIQAQEQSQLKNVGTENEASEVRGSYSYVAEDGQTYTVTYIANEYGFQPQGAHLPQAP